MTGSVAPKAPPASGFVVQSISRTASAPGDTSRRQHQPTSPRIDPARTAYSRSIMQRPALSSFVLSGALTLVAVSGGGCGARTTLFDATEPTLDASIDTNEAVEDVSDSLEPVDPADAVEVPPDLGVDTAPEAGLDAAPDTAPETALDSGRDSGVDVDSTADSGLDSARESGVDAAEAGSDSASDSPTDAGNTVKCGSTLCRLDAEECCLTTGSAPPTLQCVPRGTQCNIILACGRSADCAAGLSCCLVTTGSACQATCVTPGGQFCESNQECAAGRTCKGFLNGGGICG